MGIFARLSDIIASNVNALLDKAENPEWLIGQVIREMEDALGKAKRYAATAIAAERRLGRELEQNRSQADFWKAKAREALAASREDLARKALARKKEHDDLIGSLEIQYAEALQTGARVRTALRALEARLAEARRKQRSLLARHRAAQARVEIQKFVGTGVADFGASQAKWDRLEQRLEDFEDDLAAQAELNGGAGVEAEFAALDRQQAIDDELEALKRERDAGKQGTS
jgi:phage shock protein A